MFDFTKKLLRSIPFVALMSIGLYANAQELTTDPVGGWEDEDSVAEPAPVSRSRVQLPDEMNVEPLNHFYNTWDTLYVRRYADPIPNLNDTVTLYFDDDSYVFPRKGEFLSPFGYRGRRVHAGVDIRLNLNDTVVSAFDGVVRMAKYYSGYGNCVVVRHYNGLETLYGHLNKILVKVNQHVSAGDVVGLGGRTGRATCNHLHFETRFCGRAFNPKQIINMETFELVSDTFNVHQNTFGYKRDYMPVAGGSIAYPSANPAVKKAVTGKQTYTIRSGDTLSAIARKKGTTVAKLCKLNGIKPTKILRPGTKIRVK